MSKVDPPGASWARLTRTESHAASSGRGTAAGRGATCGAVAAAATQTVPTEYHWHELRDANGKLCARIEVTQGLLEIRRSDRELTATFNLREVLLLKSDKS